MNPLDSLDICEARYQMPQALTGQDTIHNYAKYSTECTGNNKRVKMLVLKIRRAVQAGKVILPDYFVGVGNSGMGLASVLSYEFNIPLIHIRKAEISRHVEDPENISLDKVGYPNINDSWQYPSQKQTDAVKMQHGIDWTPYLGKTFWFVDDCLDSGLTFTQAIHLTTYQRRMVCTGVALTWFTWKKKKELKRMALLKNSAKIALFKIGNAYAY